MNMPKIRFIFDRRGKATEEKQALVELEIYFNRTQRKIIPTDVSLYKDQWDSEKFVVNHVHGEELNKSLRIFRLKYERFISGMERDGIKITLDNFNERSGIGRVNKKEQVSFLDFMYDTIIKRNLRESTRRTHLVAWESLKRFGKIDSFDSLIPKNLKLFDDFIRKEDPKRKQTTIHSFHKRLKPYIVEAIKLDYMQSNPYDKFTVERGRCREREPLTQMELGNLREIELSERLDRVRDLFVFCCYTGLSFSDMCIFKYERDVIQNDEMYFISGDRLKTGTKFYTPLLDPAMNILKKYKYRLPIISMQKYNDYLHIIEERLSLNKPLTSHIARHTFATTVTLAHDVPIEAVSRMLGHKDIKTTQIYAKVLNSTIERHSKELSKLL